MGVDFTNRRFFGSVNEADLEKLPQDVQDQLIDENEVYEGKWKGLRVFYTYYTDKPEFVALGFAFQDIEFKPTEEKSHPEQKRGLFEKVGINPKVYSFIEQW